MFNEALRLYQEKYYFAEVSTSEAQQIKSFTDYKAVMEIYGSDFSNYEKLHIVTSAYMNKRKNYNFVGTKPDLLNMFGYNMVQKKFESAGVDIVYELPTTENYVEISEVYDVDNKLATPGTKLGQYNTTFYVVCNSGNWTDRNIYSLRDYPQFIFKPIGTYTPHGVGKYKWKVKLEQNFYTDYMMYGTHIMQYSEVVNLGAPMGEAAVNRGSVEMNIGKSSVAYRIGRTRMGFERRVTDVAWQAGTFMVGKIPKEDKSPDLMKAVTSLGLPEKVAFQEIDVKFVDAGLSALDNYLTTGTSKAPSDNNIVDPDTHYQVELGPTFADAIRATRAEDYGVRSFNLNSILDLCRRRLQNIENVSDKANVVFDFWLGDGSWELVQGELIDKFNYDGIVDSEYHVSDGDSKGMDPRRKQIVANRLMRTGLYLNPHGLVRFNYDSRILNSGILTGRREVNGKRISSYWMVVFCSIMGEDTKNSAVTMYTSDSLENFGYNLATWGPKGSTFKVDYSGPAYSSGGGNISGNMYKVVQEYCRTMHVDFSEVTIFYPDFNE